MVRCEDMLGQPIRTFSAVATFLGIHRDLERIRTSIKRSEFTLLRS
ncbi:MAG: hypothetical protein EXR09_11740 [Acetobacteraceae bacterium]|nr:hypothetical protein [Acetobacteraceae bacterium]